MSMKDCIDEAVKGGAMNAARAEEAKKLYDELVAQYADELGPEGASSFASRETFARLEAGLHEAGRQKLLAAVVQRRISDDLAGYHKANGKADPEEAAIALIDGTGLHPLSPSADQIHKAVRGRAHGMMDDLLSTFRRNMIGETRNKATLVNLVREAFGEKTGDVSAYELAQSWRKAAEFLRREYNAAGGHIAWREDWGLPQIHDTVKVREASFEEWRDFIVPRLDPARMRDGATGLPFAPRDLEAVLKDIYETIRTDGFATLEPSAGGGQGKSLANRRADHRFLSFRSADDWMAYQERFGRADPFSAMMGHVDHMSRDIGAMRALGPNPKATVRYVQQLLKKQARTGGLKGKEAADAIARADRGAHQVETLYGLYAGEYSSPVESGLARGLATTRQLLVSAQLGAASLSAVGDLATQRLTARFVGIPETKVLGRIVSLLNPANEADRKLAVRLGLIAEEWSRRAASQQRYVGEVATGEIASRLSDFVLRASGLSPWTQAGRWAFGMEFLGALADNAGKAFHELDPALQRTLDRYHLGGEIWEGLRKTPLYEEGGAKFLRPEDVATKLDQGTLGDELATRLLAMVQSETEYAVPSSSLRGAMIARDRVRPGTVAGELLRSVSMYRNFGLTLWFTHLRRLADQQGAYNKAGYAANLIIGMTLMGALGIQLKDISKGKDPRAMDNPAFWGAALLQGGGFGIFGDFLNSATNRVGGGLPETIAGPLVSFANDALDLTAGSIGQAARGKDPHLGRKAVRFAEQYTPGSSLWYARLTLQRLVFDQLRIMADPDARRQMRALERKYQRENGQEFFWQPGEPAPDRAPDLSSAIGGKK